jgi:hypothetical protein
MREARPRRWLALACVGAVPLFAACFDVWGTYETGSAGSGAGGSDRDPPGEGASTTVGPGGGGGASVESCTDGVDDDQDGLVDCADTADCGGFACTAAPAIDASWHGPVLLRELDDDRACPPSFPTAGPELRAVSTPCTCGCGTPTGESCNATVTVFSAGACAGTAASATVEALACGTLSGAATTAKATSEAHGGSCTASVSGGPDPGTDPPRKTCEGAAGGGCGEDELCVRPPGPDDGALCWYQEGDVVCPAGLPQRTILYDAASPPSCTGASCTCAPSSQGTCTGTVTLFDTDCSSGNTALVPLTGACTAGLATVGSVKIAGASVATAGACSPVPAFPVGVLAAARTYCCAP